MTGLRSAVLNPLLYAVLLAAAAIRIVVDPVGVTPIVYGGIVVLAFGLVAALVARTRAKAAQLDALPSHVDANSLSGPAQAVALAAGMAAGLSGLALVGPAAVFLGMLTTAVACEAIPALAPAGIGNLAGNREMPPWAQILLLSLIVGATLGFFATLHPSGAFA